MTTTAIICVIIIVARHFQMEAEAKKKRDENRKFRDWLDDVSNPNRR